MKKEKEIVIDIKLKYETPVSKRINFKEFKNESSMNKFVERSKCRVISITYGTVKYKKPIDKTKSENSKMYNLQTLVRIKIEKWKEEVKLLNHKMPTNNEIIRTGVENRNLFISDLEDILKLM